MLPIGTYSSIVRLGPEKDNLRRVEEGQKTHHNEFNGDSGSGCGNDHHTLGVD